MTTREQLTSVFHQVFDDDSIVIDDTLTADDVDGWDSLSHIHLIIATEKEFGLKFKTAEIASLKNVGDMIALIDRKRTK